MQGVDDLVMGDALDVDVEDVQVRGPPMGHVSRCAPIPLSRVMVLVVLPSGIVAAGADPKLLVGKVAIEGDDIVLLLVLLDCAEVVMVCREPQAVAPGVVVVVPAGGQRVEGEVEPQLVLVVAFNLEVQGITKDLDVGVAEGVPLGPSVCPAHALVYGIRPAPAAVDLAVEHPIGVPGALPDSGILPPIVPPERRVGAEQAEPCRDRQGCEQPSSRNGGIP